jgi:SAM-dependent methyltransferase
MSKALLELGRTLGQLGYRFTTVTPATQRAVNARPGNAVARSLRDVFGWSRPFDPGILPDGVFELMRAAEILESIPNSDLWRSTVRFSSVDGLLFAHSAFPTISKESVFLGPDSVRFVNAITRHTPLAMRVVDIGCGSGVGGIVLARRGIGLHKVVLADINEHALRLAGVNAALASVGAEIVRSDVLKGVEHDVDLVISNPPYLRDDEGRLYRHGGGEHGEALATRITKESIERLAQNPRGGALLLYTGAPIVDGEDTFLAAVVDHLHDAHAHYSYEELDPDIWPEVLEEPAYADVERVAAVLLQAHVGPRRERH